MSVCAAAADHNRVRPVTGFRPEEGATAPTETVVERSAAAEAGRYVTAGLVGFSTTAARPTPPRWYRSVTK